MIEENKRIARFMGYEYYPYNHPELKRELDAGWKNNIKASCIPKFNVWPSNNTEIEYKYLCRSHNQLQYHSNWTWIMGVVEKIESLGYSISIDTRGVRIEVPKSDILEYGNNKITNLFTAIIKFLDYYESI